MAREYHLGFGRRAANVIVSLAIRAGLPTRGAHLLTTRGRRSGEPRTTPVVVQQSHGARWIVSPYGTRPWVLNVRDHPQVLLQHSRRRERVHLVEVDAATAAPVLQQYAREQVITRPFFDIPHDAPVEAFEAEAHAHPVFRVERPPE